MCCFRFIYPFFRSNGGRFGQLITACVLTTLSLSALSATTNGLLKEEYNSGSYSRKFHKSICSACHSASNDNERRSKEKTLLLTTRYSKEWEEFGIHECNSKEKVHEGRGKHVPSITDGTRARGHQRVGRGLGAVSPLVGSRQVCSSSI